MNKSYWRGHTSKRFVKFLIGIREPLKAAWLRDRQGTEEFPLDTHYLLAHAEAQLRGHPSKLRRRKLLRLNPPKTLNDIFDEKLGRTVREVYEYLYEEPLDDAFRKFNSTKEARVADLTGLSKYKQIIEAIKTALDVTYFGPEVALPKPRGNWLHRQLLRIATAAKLGDLTNKQMAEFFNDICPCGTKHTREAIKKFRQRRTARGA